MSEQYILPGELVALIAFWFVPPLLIACSAQSWFFVSRGIFRRHRWRAIGALIGTIIVSVVVGVSLLAASPTFLPRWLGVNDVWLGGKPWPVLPLSFLSVALVAAIFTFLGARNAHITAQPGA